MRRSPSAAVAAALLAALLAVTACADRSATSAGTATPPAAKPNLPGIPEVDAVDGTATLDLVAALDKHGRPAFYWKDQEVAPTIRLRPGDSIHLHYENRLPQVCGLGLESDSNLHFHGLTTAPIVHGDDVIATKVQPGTSFDYIVKINPDQPPGLYWYHPHPHGLANWEIDNGMAGAIVVEGIADEIRSLAGLREQVFVLRDEPNDTSVAAAELLTARAQHGFPSAAPPDPDEVGPPCGVETSAQPSINGFPSATIAIKPGERQLWRIVNASGHRHFDLALVNAKMAFERGSMQLAGIDGVPLGYYRNAAPLRPIEHIVIPPAGRAEIVVTGPPLPDYLVSLCYNAGPSGDINPWAILGGLIDDDARTPMDRIAAPFGLRPAPEYLAVPPPAERRVIRFEEDKKGFYIDHKAYNPAGPPLITARVGTTEEWTLENDTDEVHDFHIHQVHFIAESTNGIPEAHPHWADTVDIPPQRHGPGNVLRPSTVKVLLDFRDPVIRGTFLFHCHIVDHEDGGMMAKIRLI